MFTKEFQKILQRDPDSHKFSFGHVLVIGGSAGMVGAPLLTAHAALRSGAGLVTIASTAEVIDKLEGRVPELMTYRMTGSAELVATDIADFIAARKVSVITIGSGMVVTTENKQLLTEILRQQTIPIVLDGGALSMLHDNVELLKTAVSKHIILTPHLGEFQKLVPEQLPAERTDLQPIVRRFAHAYSVTMALKGNPTYVTDRGDELYENATGNPGLATAGSGDVLTGMVAAFIAQGLSSKEATSMAVYLHGLASDLAAEAKTQPGMIATDIIECIPTAFKSA